METTQKQSFRSATNYRDFIAENYFEEKSASLDSYRISNIHLSWQEWVIEIRSLINSDDVFKTLKSQGGFGLTHLGLIQKNDHSNFTFDKVEKLLIGLRFFLSFSKGCWSNPSLGVFLNDSDEKIAEYFTPPNVPWSSHLSWFDQHHTEQLEELFPLFMNKWSDSSWFDALRESIYWYIRSNNSNNGIDAGIILTQSSIERLSFEYVVNDKKLLSSKGFKALWASDKYRLLFSSIGIPVKIPKELKNINKLSNQFTWIDAPHALTEIRNSLIHPDHKKKEQFRETSLLFEAWNLGLWYLEL